MVRTTSQSSIVCQLVKQVLLCLFRGQALAVGFPFYGKNRETTIVYKKIHPTECDGSSKLLCFSFTTDEKPHESRCIQNKLAQT